MFRVISIDYTTHLNCKLRLLLLPHNGHHQQVDCSAKTIRYPMKAPKVMLNDRTAACRFFACYAQSQNISTGIHLEKDVKL